MTVYLEMALRLQREIDSGEAHLANLRAALAALQPLVTVDSNASRTLELSYRPKRADAEQAQLVEEIAETTPSVKPKTRKARAGASDARGSLPATNAALWVELMGRRARTINDIVDRALQRFELPEDARPVLANRLSAWLYPAMKAGKIALGSPKGKLKRYQIIEAQA